MIPKKLSINATQNMTGAENPTQDLNGAKKKLKAVREKCYKQNYVVSYAISTPQSQKWAFYNDLCGGQNSHPDLKLVSKILNITSFGARNNGSFHKLTIEAHRGTMK